MQYLGSLSNYISNMSKIFICLIIYVYIKIMFKSALRACFKNKLKIIHRKRDFGRIYIERGRCFDAKKYLTKISKKY